MNDELEQLLRNLRLDKIAEILDEEIKRAHKDKRGFEQWLARLLRAQWHRNQEKALDYRVRRARLPENWTLESFP